MHHEPSCIWNTRCRPSVRMQLVNMKSWHLYTLYILQSPGEYCTGKCHGHHHNNCIMRLVNEASILYSRGQTQLSGTSSVTVGFINQSIHHKWWMCAQDIVQRYKRYGACVQKLKRMHAKDIRFQCKCGKDMKVGHRLLCNYCADVQN